jgi:hypothetical protein
LDEQGACQGHTHPPSSTEFLGFLVLHLDGEPKTEQNLRGTGFGGTRVELVKPAIDAFLKSKKTNESINPSTTTFWGEETPKRY